MFVQVVVPLVEFAKVVENWVEFPLEALEGNAEDPERRLVELTDGLL